ncbi:MAG: hypothetical protein ABI619_10585, partial [Betaproteobacteria bacterium]
MNVKQFVATNARDALRQVKRELGADAVILSNRRVEAGVEILAIPHAEARALDVAAREAVSARPAPIRTATNNPAPMQSRSVRLKMPVAGPLPRAQANPPAPQTLPTPPIAAAPIVAPAGEQIARTVINEIRSMRGLIHEQLSGLVFGEMQRREPGKLRMMSTLLASGFSPALSRRLLDKA